MQVMAQAPLKPQTQPKPLHPGLELILVQIKAGRSGLIPTRTEYLVANQDVQFVSRGVQGGVDVVETSVRDNINDISQELQRMVIDSAHLNVQIAELNASLANMDAQEQGVKEYLSHDAAIDANDRAEAEATVANIDSDRVHRMVELEQAEARLAPHTERIEALRVRMSEIVGPVVHKFTFEEIDALQLK